MYFFHHFIFIFVFYVAFCNAPFSSSTDSFRIHFRILFIFPVFFVISSIFFITYIHPNYSNNEIISSSVLFSRFYTVFLFLLCTEDKYFVKKIIAEVLGITFRQILQAGYTKSFSNLKREIETEKIMNNDFHPNF